MINNCPSCKEVLGSFTYSGVYTLVSDSATSICPDGCLYKNNMGQHFCFREGGLQVKQCIDLNSDNNIPESVTENIISSTELTIDNDFFIIGGGSSAEGSSRSVSCYSEAGRMLDAPDLPPDLVGGVAGGSHH